MKKTTHIRIEQPLKAWMEANRQDGDTPTDQIQRALIAQAHYDAGEKKPGTITMRISDRMQAERRLAELEEL
jgi:hypothetical protein